MSQQVSRGTAEEYQADQQAGVMWLGAALRAGVVPGGDGLRAETVGRLEQGAELYRRVAEDAGIGRLAAQIALTERRADLFLELRADVEDLERELEKGRRLHGVPPRVFVGVVEIEAADLPARAAQQRGGHGGIDAAGKRFIR